MKKGEASAEMFLVEGGEVSVAVDESEIARLGPGKFFGEMALMTGEPRNATVRAAGACCLLVIDAPSKSPLPPPCVAPHQHGGAGLPAARPDPQVFLALAHLRHYGPR